MTNQGKRTRRERKAFWEGFMWAAAIALGACAVVIVAVVVGTFM